jgi:hypothetical protein
MAETEKEALQSYAFPSLARYGGHIALTLAAGSRSRLAPLSSLAPHKGPKFEECVGFMVMTAS